jgi:hypothetical protein
MPIGIRLRGWRRCDEGEVAGIAAIELVRVGLEIREVTLSRGREGGLRVSLPPACPMDQARALEVLWWRLPGAAKAFAVEVSAAVAARHAEDLARIFAPPRRR